MDLTTTSRDGVTLHAINGRIDAATSTALEGAVLAGIAGGGARVLMDMRAVSYVSSAGLRVVLMATKQARAARGGVVLFGLQPAVREVFAISGFDKIVPIVAGEAEGLAVLGG